MAKKRTSVAATALGLLLVLAALVIGLDQWPRSHRIGVQEPAPPTTVPVAPTTRALEPIPEVVPNLRLLSSAERAVDVGCEEAVNIQPPATDLASLVASLPPGTCFLLSEGTYRFRDVVPKDFMSFIGASAAEVLVLGDADAENAFHGTAAGVTIARMTFTGFQGAAGEKRQEQAPIRGTSAIWASDRGEMATEWLVDSIVSSDNFANGIFLGDHFTVRNSRFEGNGVTGLSGSEVVGGLVENNLVTANGAEQASGFEVNGGGMKFGESGMPSDPLVVRDNEVFENEGIGIWCDIGCRGFHVIDNYIHDQSSRGVMYELSQNAVIRGNTIIDANTWTDFSNDFNAGAITVGESSAVLIEDNFISGSESAITIRQTARPVRPGESFLDNYEFVEYTTSDVLVQNNVIERSEAVGISTGKTGVGLITDPMSIRFEGNSYDDPQSMRFWWNDGNSMDFGQWQSAGRDTQSVATATPDEVPWQLGAASAPLSADQDSADLITIPVAINAGGGEIVDSFQQTWIADRFYLGGNPGVGSGSLDSPETQESVYQTERWGLRGYSIPLPDGDYQLELHHAEIFDGCQQSDCRVFTIQVEGDDVVIDLDVFDRVGGRQPLVISTLVSVSDGSLDIDFVPGLQEPQISGLIVDHVG